MDKHTHTHRDTTKTLPLLHTREIKSSFIFHCLYGNVTMASHKPEFIIRRIHTNQEVKSEISNLIIVLIYCFKRFQTFTLISQFCTFQLIIITMSKHLKYRTLSISTIYINFTIILTHNLPTGRKLQKTEQF